MITTDLIPQDLLTRVFGIQKLRDKQRQSIDLTMSGKHSLALLPTGYGKSLCYQLPSQLLPGVTLVISPLIALMEDQINGLRKRGITNATVLNSSVAPEELQERLDGIRAGAYKLVYIAPERLDSPRFRALIASINVSLLVIDEAHCISQWGHDFRPQYRNMKAVIEQVPDATVLALTATATPRVQKDIVDNLGLPMTVVLGDFDRPNLRLEVEKCENAADKDRLLFARLKKLSQESDGSTIVYVSSRKEAEALSKRLTDNGFKAAYYHAGLPVAMRKAAQKRFEEDKIKVIVCTVAFGMGVDKATIRRVIHYNLPPSLENYYQEAGRAGRDGEPATCTLLYQSKDIFTQRWLTKMNYPTDEQVQQVYDLLHKNKNTAIRPSSILDKIKIKDTALSSTLDLFNQQGLLTLTPDGVLLNNKVAAESGSPGDRGLVKTSPAKVDLTILNQRRQLDEDRLERMISFATGYSCRRQTVLHYFGQKLATSCSGCDICHTDKVFIEPFYAPLKSTTSPTPTPRTRTSRTSTGASSSSSTSTSSANTGSTSRSGVTYRDTKFGSNKPASYAGPGVDKSTGYDTTGLDALSQSIILLTGQLKGQVGRTTVAGILSGSQNKKLKEKGLDQNALYGTFAHKRQESIMEAIDALIEEGKLRVIPGMYPKLTLR
ncbi:MAG: RecQ family ATP-dependent DNA helicase [Candidatus Obscuribacter sp.]|nr:RecQ family ATP-dependent DNA helicase [Candidatus Obscuribacter sp.]